MKNLKLALAGVGLSAVMLLSACGNEVENVEYVHGTVDGNKFSSSMFGLTVEFGEEWTFTSDDELAEMSGIDDMTAESAKSAFTSSGLLYEMYAAKEDGSNIGFLVEDLSQSNNSSLDEKGYVDASYPQLESQLIAQGLTVNSIERSTDTFAGKETPCVQIEVSVMGINAYEYQVYKKAGQYMGVITVTSMNSMDEAKEFASKFAAL